MLRWIPEERKSARELLDDLWLKGRIESKEYKYDCESHRNYEMIFTQILEPGEPGSG